MSRGVRWREEPLARRQDRAGFDCGVPALNDYLQGYAMQNHERGGAKTFVAVSLTAQGQGLGADLLLVAGARALAVAREVGGVALAIDAKDERVAAWYQRFGALRLLDDPLKLVLPLETIRLALGRPETS